MSKKHDFHIKYSIPVNGENFYREFTVRSVVTSEQAESKLKKFCNCEIIIISIEKIA